MELVYRYLSRNQCRNSPQLRTPSSRSTFHQSRGSCKRQVCCELARTTPYLRDWRSISKTTHWACWRTAPTNCKVKDWCYQWAALGFVYCSQIELKLRHLCNSEATPAITLVAPTEPRPTGSWASAWYNSQTHARAQVRVVYLTVWMCNNSLDKTSQRRLAHC